ncbi:hypothetical protein K439DRAFT_1656249 [Ramaria rubella]|nr:hypothetical protein K439DRAFT_1656249 [Ramaria rubella]
MAVEHKQKIICLGLGRTGTSSLRDAMEMIGFGPCYHFKTIVEAGGKDLVTWIRIGEGNGTLQDFHTLLDNYTTVLDNPPAMFPQEMYAAYPDAKFILTTRDPAKWEQSMNNTVMRIPEKITRGPDASELEKLVLRWWEIQSNHRGRLADHAQQEFLDHNERVKQLIPPEKLLVYEVGEGWDRLVEFLGVPKPTVPFPHVWTTAEVEAAFQFEALKRSA